MKKFLLKGILKDKGRSLLPVIVVSLGALLTVFLYSWVKGVMGDSIEMSSNFDTGDVKVVTRAYARQADQYPNDLAILGVDTLLEALKAGFPDMDWAPRIRFGALADFPDSLGETRGQGPVAGWAVDLLGEGSREPERFNLPAAIVRGRMPESRGEVLLAENLASRFDAGPGDSFTLFGTTMEGGFTFVNYTIAGTVRFGATGLDRGAVLMDLQDARAAFAMEDAAGEILGFLPVFHYDDRMAQEVVSRFQAGAGSGDGISGQDQEYAPVMITLGRQAGMAEMLVYAEAISGMLIFLFVLAMSIVLWNAGLLGGLRRYTEFGIRIALGEDKGHIYRSLLWEALVIGSIGSILGTFVGVVFVYIFHHVGFNFSSMMQQASMLIPGIMRPAITPAIYYIGFIPGVLSMLLGNALAGRGIYKRQTSRLFNELEV
ncbi:MAG: FtsX-like permease family protein [Bacteroidales bacterium]|jgi:putative ABC transport system permease protein|nr:FtsX-like permease family protein [Bacteroidales bacterium]MDD2824300.1 FtsX-like permease family protein [Bacteroidales bacterium]MDD3101070.1 FtsX-like permease family protein [Bacteroidales bacterium]MDD3639631.1 FtsX-like permease family protein [Bacteroidales bacterium]MDD3944419.1 FtsX-like permease family protein [Bacteroidales bacterium]